MSTFDFWQAKGVDFTTLSTANIFPFQKDTLMNVPMLDKYCQLCRLGARLR